MEVKIDISDVGLHYKAPAYCKACGNRKEVLLACIAMYVNNRELFKVWVALCKNCYRQLYNKFLEFNER